MEAEVKENLQTPAAPVMTATPIAPAGSAVSPQSCPNCGTAAGANGGEIPLSWIYALGRIEARFPSISVEKEFAQVTGRDKTSGLTDRQAFHAVLAKSENRYLVRQLTAAGYLQAGMRGGHLMLQLYIFLAARAHDVRRRHVVA